MRVVLEWSTYTGGLVVWHFDCLGQRLAKMKRKAECDKFVVKKFSNYPGWWNSFFGKIAYCCFDIFLWFQFMMLYCWVLGGFSPWVTERKTSSIRRKVACLCNHAKAKGYLSAVTQTRVHRSALRSVREQRSVLSTNICWKVRADWNFISEEIQSI